MLVDAFGALYGFMEPVVLGHDGTALFALLVRHKPPTVLKINGCLPPRLFAFLNDVWEKSLHSINGCLVVPRF